MTDQQPITEEELHAYVDGRLDERRANKVCDYMANNPTTAERVSAYRQQRKDLQSAFGAIAQAPIPATLDIRGMVERRRRRSMPWRASVAAAAALMVGFGSGWLLKSAAIPPQNGVAALAREAADNYRVYASDAVHPVEIGAGDQTQLVSWVSTRLKRQVKPPNLVAAGYRLLGGRLVTTPHGPAALFLYDNDLGVRLAVMVRPMAIEKQTRMAEDANQGLGGVSWADRGLGYSVVGSPPADVLHPIADEIRNQVDQPS